MPRTFPKLARAVVFALPLACSEGQSDDAAPGGGGSAAGEATGGTAGSGAAGGGAGLGGGAAGGATAGGAGAAGSSGATGDARRFVPEGLPNTEVNGEGGLTLAAFTLVAGATGPESYAAVRNDGEMPACEAGMRIDFFDRAGELVTSAASVLQSGRLYRIDDGSGTIIACVPPGEIAMAAFTDLPETVVIEALGRLEHQFPAFQLSVVPIDGLTVSDLQAITTSGGATFTGTVTNGLDGPVRNPKVSVFPLTSVGRPLGAATSSATLDVPADGTWSFETNAVSDAGAAAVAYPAASIAD